MSEIEKKTMKYFHNLDKEYVHKPQAQEFHVFFNFWHLAKI